MKKFILGSASAAALLFAGAAFAGDVSTINQPGNSNLAQVDQTASTNATSTITQNSNGDSASVTQGGAANVSTVSQNGDGGDGTNVAQITQVGSNGSSDVAQYGGNFAGVTQDSSSTNESAFVRQTGYNPGAWGLGGATLYQDGLGNSGFILQDGYFNSSVVVQTGTGGYSGGINESLDANPNNYTNGFSGSGSGSQQVGNNNTSYIFQSGNADLTINDAQGYGNFQYSTQTGTSGATALNVAYGNSNSGTIGQFGGTAFSALWQNGSSNQASTWQDGSSTSLIGQGALVGNDGIDYSFGSETPTFDAVATVTQIGGGQYSDIEQWDSATATVFQANGGGGNNSIVTQNAGSYGSNANVDQEGAGGNSIVTESGAYDGASVTQSFGSTDESSTVTQTGGSDGANVSQSGAGDTSGVTQSGYEDGAGVTQSGGSNTSSVTQTGNYDGAGVTQSGSSEQSTIVQSGDSNSATVNQWGGSDVSNILQAGSNNLASVSQGSGGAVSTISQSGSSNSAIVHQ